MTTRQGAASPCPGGPATSIQWQRYPGLGEDLAYDGQTVQCRRKSRVYRHLHHNFHHLSRFAADVQCSLYMHAKLR